MPPGWLHRPARGCAEKNAASHPLSRLPAQTAALAIGQAAACESPCRAMRYASPAMQAPANAPPMPNASSAAPTEIFFCSDIKRASLHYCMQEGV